MLRALGRADIHRHPHRPLLSQISALRENLSPYDAAYVALADAVERLPEPEELPEQLGAFGISGKTGGGLRALFMSHPPLDERIAALKQHSV